MTDRSHGVTKTWSCWITEAGEINFPYISQVACICREVRSLIGEKISKEIAIQVTSATRGEMSGADMNKHTREHWWIENKSHYTRDTVYREDHNQSWKGNGPHALASLRNFATGLFRMKNVKSIKEATEMVHMDRMLAFYYMTTMRDIRCTALPANGPAYSAPRAVPGKSAPTDRTIRARQREMTAMPVPSPLLFQQAPQPKIYNELSHSRYSWAAFSCRPFAGILRINS